MSTLMFIAEIEILSRKIILLVQALKDYSNQHHSEEEHF